MIEGPFCPICSIVGALADGVKIGHQGERAAAKSRTEKPVASGGTVEAAIAFGVVGASGRMIQAGRNEEVQHNARMSMNGQPNIYDDRPYRVVPLYAHHAPALAKDEAGDALLMEALPALRCYASNNQRWISSSGEQQDPSGVHSVLARINAHLKPDEGGSK